MRVRLLLDSEIDADDLAALGELIANQPVATVQINGHPLLGARFVGAQLVQVDPGELP